MRKQVVKYTEKSQELNGRMVIHIDEKKIEYFVDDKETSYEVFVEWLIAYNELPDEEIRIETWIEE